MRVKYKPLYRGEHGEDLAALVLSSTKIMKACVQKTPSRSKVDGLLLELATS